MAAPLHSGRVTGLSMSTAPHDKNLLVLLSCGHDQYMALSTYRLAGEAPQQDQEEKKDSEDGNEPDDEEQRPRPPALPKEVSDSLTVYAAAEGSEGPFHFLKFDAKRRLVFMGANYGTVVYDLAEVFLQLAGQLTGPTKDAKREPQWVAYLTDGGRKDRDTAHKGEMLAFCERGREHDGSFCTAGTDKRCSLWELNYADPMKSYAIRWVATGTLNAGVIDNLLASERTTRTTALCFVPQLTALAAGLSDGSVALYDLSTPESHLWFVIPASPTTSGHVASLVWKADTMSLLVANGTTVRSWQMPAQKMGEVTIKAVPSKPIARPKDEQDELDEQKAKAESAPKPPAKAPEQPEEHKQDEPVEAVRKESRDDQEGL